jgi:4-hydroxybenzoate polyprenyltransferase
VRNLLTFFRQIYLLELIGALAVVCLGWACCQLTGSSWQRSAPLWLGGYLLVYNLDRLYDDPADRLNTPVRFRYRQSLRTKRLVIILLSTVLLVAWPICTGRWWLVPVLGLVAWGLQFYSRPIPGVKRRLKDVPVVKSFIAPLFIAVVLALWPAIETGRSLGAREALVFLWCFLVLSVNSVSFDLRDIPGDRAAGTRTVAVVLGKDRTMPLLGVLGCLAAGLSWTVTHQGLPHTLMPAGVALGVGLLFTTVFCQAKPMLLSFVADLLLFVPAMVLLLGR